MYQKIFIIVVMLIATTISSFAVRSATYTGTKSASSSMGIDGPDITIGGRYLEAWIKCTDDACVLVCRHPDQRGSECSFGSPEIVWCEGCIESDLFINAEVEELEEYAETEVENGNLSGTKHLNIEKYGIKYYRCVEWSIDLETNIFEFTISITEDDE